MTTLSLECKSLIGKFVKLELTNGSTTFGILNSFSDDNVCIERDCEIYSKNIQSITHVIAI